MVRLNNREFQRTKRWYLDIDEKEAKQVSELLSVRTQFHDFHEVFRAAIYNLYISMVREGKIKQLNQDDML